jgi:hypothetical protein
LCDVVDVQVVEVSHKTLLPQPRTTLDKLCLST